MTMATWHVHHAGTTRLVSVDCLDDAVSSGMIPDDSLVWREGMPDWSRAAALVALEDRTADAPQAAPLRPPRADNPAARPGFRVIGAALSAVATGSLAMSARGESLTDASATLIAAGTAVRLEILIHAVLALGVAGLLVLLCRHPGRTRSPGAACVLMVLGFTATVVGGATAIRTHLMAEDTVLWLDHRDRMENASIGVLAPGVLVLEGPIGPRLLADYHAVAGGEPVRTLVVTSEGGLVIQALDLAAEIEQTGVDVVVRNECLSACLALAMAGKRLYAEAGSVFGFHQGGSEVPLLSDLASYEARATHEMFDRYLAARGMPEAMLAEGNGYGPVDMMVVDAETLRRLGVIDTLLAPGQLP